MAPKPQPHLERPQLGARTLVVAEDNASVRARLLHELSLCAPGLAVGEATTAAQAVALLAEHHPDVLVLDVSLPDRDGCDLGLALRRGGFAGRLVLLTTDRSDAARTDAARAGASLLHKPFTREDVLAALARDPMPAPAEVAARPGVLLPSASVVRSLLAELLHCEVDVAPGLPVLPRLLVPSTVGLYVRDRLQTGAVVVADTRMSLLLAGSLAALPAETLTALLDARSWPGTLDDDLGEACDMLRPLFTLPSTPSLRLYSVHRPGSPPDAPLARAAASVRSRLDLLVSVPGHSPAGLSLVVPTS